jgi:membrane-associated phospholipid phosphatase
MKKTFGGIKVYWMLIVLGLCLLGIIFGSFWDFSLSNAIAKPNNGFGVFFESFGEALGYAMVPIAGTLIFMGLKDDRPIGLKILGWIILIASIGIPTYILGHAATKPYTYVLPIYWAYPIAFVIMTLSSMFTYFLAGVDDKNVLLKAGLTILIAMLIQLAIVTVLKGLAERPRYRYLIVSSNATAFRDWWNWDPSNFMGMILKGEDGLKSFPSGHTATSSVCFLLPLLASTKPNKLFKGEEAVLFILGGLYTLIIAYARISAGAHFLSDVSFGALIGSATSFLTVFIAYQPKKEAVKAA